MTRQVRGAKDNGRKTEDGRKSAPNASGRKALIDRLNHELAREYEAILMYTHYLAELTGPCRGEVRAQFQAEIADKQSHAQFLADKVAALGGKPTTQRARC
jgi:bacterioferritin